MRTEKQRSKISPEFMLPGSKVTPESLAEATKFASEYNKRAYQGDGERTVTTHGATIIHGNLVLSRNAYFNGPLLVEGSIIGEGGSRHELEVNGDLSARSIYATDVKVHGNIRSGNIDVEGKLQAMNVRIQKRPYEESKKEDYRGGDIKAANIHATHILAENIDAEFIVCQTVALPEGAKLHAKHVITKRNSYEKDAWTTQRRDIVRE